MGPTSSALYDDAVHARHWICIGLRHVGLFPPPVPSFPSLGTLPSRLGDHVNPSFNHITDDCFPLPVSDRSPPPAFMTPSTVPHPIAVLQSLPLHSAPSSFFVLDPDFPASEPILSTHLPSPFSATFGLPFTSSFGTNYVHAFTFSKLLSCYSAPSIPLKTLSHSATPSTYAEHLATCCPFQLGGHFVNHLIDIHLFTFIDAATSPTEFFTRSLVNTVSSARPVPSPLNWLAAYDQDTDSAHQTFAEAIDHTYPLCL
jgi:hypothetical protein